MQVCRGGDEISFTNMGLVAETVLAQVCVRLVSSLLVGWPAGLVLEAWWPGVQMSRWPLYVCCCGGSTPLLGDQVGAWLCC